MPQIDILVNIGGENLYHAAKLAKNKGVLCWKLYGNQGYEDFEKYPYWCYPEAPMKKDTSYLGYMSDDIERLKKIE